MTTPTYVDHCGTDKRVLAKPTGILTLAMGGVQGSKVPAAPTVTPTGTVTRRRIRRAVAA